MAAALSQDFRDLVRDITDLTAVEVPDLVANDGPVVLGAHLRNMVLRDVLRNVARSAELAANMIEEVEE